MTAKKSRASKTSSLTFTESAWFFPLTFALLLFGFYPELFLARSAPLVGDHWEQHYPWAALLASSLKQGMLPLWTTAIQCGFPIAAESQIGIFYLPNLALFGLFPVKQAFAWQLPLHFWIGGWSTYAYLREMGMKKMSSFLGACLFVFGTAYGGAYYNVTSLKTLCWFPFMLFQLERYLQRGTRSALAGLAAAGALSMVAGYLQVAVLGGLMVFFYTLLRLTFLRDETPHFRNYPYQTLGGLFVSALGIGLLIFPQLLLTYPLALASNRSGAAEGYAYAGSLSPLVFSTWIFPHFQGLFRGHCLYNGILPLFFAAIAFSRAEIRKSLFFKLWAAMGIFALLMALGRWSPLYVGLIKLTGFHAFRTPAKFLVFINFAFAMLAAAGLEAYLRIEEARRERKTQGTAAAFACLLGGAAGTLFTAGFAVRHYRSAFENAGRGLVEKFVLGQPGHPHDLSFYMEKLNAYLDYAAQIFSPLYSWNLWIFLIITASLLLVLFFRGRRFFIPAAGLLILLDLYVFSYGDLRTDFLPTARIEENLHHPAIQALQKEQAAGLLNRLYGFRKPDESLPTVPSVNMLLGIEDIGAYSPLISGRYYETLGLFGNINDSNQALTPTPGFVAERIPLLSAMGVSHILSTAEMRSPKLDLLSKGPDYFLYRNLQAYPPYFFTSQYRGDMSWQEIKNRLLSAEYDPRDVVLFERNFPESGPGRGSASGVRPVIQHFIPASPLNEAWQVAVSEPGFFVWMQTWDSGWSVTVNGKKQPVEKAYGLFQAVYLDQPGTYYLNFQYSIPSLFNLKGKKA